MVALWHGSTVRLSKRVYVDWLFRCQVERGVMVMVGFWQCGLNFLQETMFTPRRQKPIEPTISPLILVSDLHGVYFI